MLLAPHRLRALCRNDVPFVFGDPTREDTEAGARLLSQNLHRQLLGILNIEAYLASLNDCQRADRPSREEVMKWLDNISARIQISSGKIEYLRRWVIDARLDYARDQLPDLPTKRRLDEGLVGMPGVSVFIHPAAKRLVEAVDHMEDLRVAWDRDCGRDGPIKMNSSVMIACYGTRRDYEGVLEILRLEALRALDEIGTWLKEEQVSISRFIVKTEPSEPRLNPKRLKKVAEGAVSQAEHLGKQ